MYANDDPVNAVDPSGKAAKFILCVIGIAGAIYSFIAGPLQTVRALSVLSSPIALEAAGEAYAAIVNSLLPGIGQIIFAGLIAIAVTVLTVCAYARSGQ